MEFVAETEGDLEPIAKHLLQTAKEQKVFTFSGDLGAGKTTLIKEFCRQAQVIDTVSSPTFGLVNEYETRKGERIYHFDCYRMKAIEEAYDIGFEEYIDSGDICLIEWAEIVEPILPQHYTAVKISLQPSGTRLFEIESL